MLYIRNFLYWLFCRNVSKFFVPDSDPSHLDKTLTQFLRLTFFTRQVCRLHISPLKLLKSTSHVLHTSVYLHFSKEILCSCFYSSCSLSTSQNNEQDDGEHVYAAQVVPCQWMYSGSNSSKRPQKSLWYSRNIVQNAVCGPAMAL